MGQPDVNTTPQAIAKTGTSIGVRRRLIGTATFSFLLAGCVGLLIHVRTVRQMEADNYSALANVLSVNCLRPLTYRQHKQAAEALSVLAQMRKVRSASIIQQDGSILATYERAAPDQGRPSPDARQDVHQYVHPSQLLITASVGTTENRKGTLLLRIDTLTPWSFVTEHFSWWAAAYAGTFLVAIVAAVCLRRGQVQTQTPQRPVATLPVALSSASISTSIDAVSPPPIEPRTSTTSSHLSETAAEALQNVGNVLNSVNVSVQMVRSKVSQSRADRLGPAIGLIQEHRQDLGHFLTDDARGRLLPDFLEQLSQAINAEQCEIRQDLTAVETCVNHISNLVNLQQACATTASRCEFVSAIDLMEDAVTLNQDGLELHGINLERDYQFTGMLHVDRHKILQILINLISNARNALQAATVDYPRLILSITSHDEEHCCFAVTDNGAGISPEDLSGLVQSGLTIRDRGHSFGLRSAALTARDLGGELHGSSAGLGAEFTLIIPVMIGEVCACPA